MCLGHIKYPLLPLFGQVNQALHLELNPTPPDVLRLSQILLYSRCGFCNPCNQNQTFILNVVNVAL